MWYPQRKSPYGKDARVSPPTAGVGPADPQFTCALTSSAGTAFLSVTDSEGGGYLSETLRWGNNGRCKCSCARNGIPAESGVTKSRPYSEGNEITSTMAERGGTRGKQERRSNRFAKPGLKGRSWSRGIGVLPSPTGTWLFGWVALANRTATICGATGRSRNHQASRSGSCGGARTPAWIR